MAIKPSPTIAGKLRKLFSNNKQTIEPAIGDSVPGGGDPVIVDVTTLGNSTGTWSGATWEELVDAFYRGMAFLRLNSQIGPGVTGQTVISLGIYVDTGTGYALYALLGSDPIILDDSGGVSGNLP